MVDIKQLARRLGVALGLAGAAAAWAGGTVGTTLPADFPVIVDASLNKPVIGFGAAGRVKRTPVIFLHGNNDAPFAYPASCAVTSTNLQAMAQAFADFGGYSPSELWALGYQGDQCDIVADSFDQTLRSSVAHTNAANVPDLRNFVNAVLAYTQAKEVDIVAHGMGVTLAREWVRQDRAARKVRRFVAIEGPNQGMIICSADPLNPWQSNFKGGYPGSPLCDELGSPKTTFLTTLNNSIHKIDPMDTLVIRNLDASCLFKLPDGLLSCLPFGTPPTVDSFGNPNDFSQSARISNAKDLGLIDQSQWDHTEFTAHIGIASSPVTWAATILFLSRR